MPVISTTVIFGEKPVARAPSISGWVTLDAAISPTAPQRSQIRNATELDVVVIVRAGEKRVAALDAMHEALLHQEIERAIDGDRRRPRDVLAPVPRSRHRRRADDATTSSASSTWRRIGVKRWPRCSQTVFRMRDRVRRAAGVIVTRFVKDGRRGLRHWRLSSHRSACAHPETADETRLARIMDRIVSGPTYAQILRCAT